MKPTQEQSDGWVEVVFTCPHCGCPYATFKEKSIDLHAGACYTCGECGKLVTFVAEKIPYERKPTSPDALAEAVKAFPCPTDEEVWLEYGWRPERGTDNMLWYNEGRSHEFRHFWLAFMKKIRTDEPKGRMYFKIMIRPVTQEWIVGEEALQKIAALETK